MNPRLDHSELPPGIAVTIRGAVETLGVHRLHATFLSRGLNLPRLAASGCRMCWVILNTTGFFLSLILTRLLCCLFLCGHALALALRRSPLIQPGSGSDSSTTLTFSRSPLPIPPQWAVPSSIYLTLAPWPVVTRFSLFSVILFCLLHLSCIFMSLISSLHRISSTGPSCTPSAFLSSARLLFHHSSTLMNESPRYKV